MPDFDGDLLLNHEELVWGTDAHNPDTDHDGLTDHDEIYLSHTSPTQIDSNRNGISDYNEFYGNFSVPLGSGSSSPYDHDGDGLPDPIDPNPYSSDNTPDSDGDTVVDSQDTHPLDPTRWRDGDQNGTNDDAEAPGADLDQDGVSNATDSHPRDPTLLNDWNGNGVNDPHEDWDGDGVSNLQDSHPNANHLWCDWNSNSLNDDAEAGQRDHDGDGHSDASDSHPWNRELWKDWNGDGVNDGQTSLPRPKAQGTDAAREGSPGASDLPLLNSHQSEDGNPMEVHDSQEARADASTDQDRDADGDGSPDAYDTHPQDPTRWNDKNDNGTNDSQEVVIIDHDEDGYANASDTHPTDPKRWNDHNQDGTNDESQAPPDRDQDGLSDSTDPLPQDTDNDGLTNQEESRLGSHPNNPDTDGDGLTDGLETYSGTDPGHVDTDGDGLTDTEELIAYHTDPTEPTGVSSDPAEEDTLSEEIAPAKATYAPAAIANSNQTKSPSAAEPTSSGKENLTSSSTSSPPVSLTLQIPGIMTGSLKRILLPNGAFLSFPSASGTSDKSDLSKKIILTNLSETQTLNGFYVSFSGADVNQFTVSPTHLTGGLAPGASRELTLTFKAPSPTNSPRFATFSLTAVGQAQPLHTLQLRSIVSSGLWQTHRDTFYADFTDSDEDGIPDRVELMYEPLVITPDGDLDGDGIPNLAQYRAGLDLRGNAHASDLDADGMSDNLENAWGKVYFGSLNKARFADAYEDPDGDGLLTIEEITGTWGNANDPSPSLMSRTNPFTSASGPNSSASTATLHFPTHRPVPEFLNFAKGWSWIGLHLDFEAWLDDGLLRLATQEARQPNGQPFTAAQFYAPACVYPRGTASPNTASFAPGYSHLPLGYIVWLRSKGIRQLPAPATPAAAMQLPEPDSHSTAILAAQRARLRPVTDADHDGLPTDWEAAQKLGNETASELNWRHAADSHLRDARALLAKEITERQQQMQANSAALAALTGTTRAVNTQRAALERENLRLDHERLACLRVLDQLDDASTEPFVEAHRIATTGTNTALILPYAIAPAAFPAASRLTATSSAAVRSTWITEQATARAWQLLHALDPDHDGLMNADEYALGLSPRLPDYTPTGDRDSDGDGIQDVTENFMGTHPLLASSYPPFKITLISGGAQSGVIHQPLARPIVFQVTYNGTLRKAGLDLTTPIPGLPLRVSSSHGNATLVASLPSGINASVPIPPDQQPTPDAWSPAGLTPSATHLPTDAQGRLTLAVKLPYAATNTATVLTAASLLNANLKASASATLTRAPSDTDGDGLPNAWETQPATAGRPAHGLNATNPLDADVGPQHFGYHRDTPTAKLPTTLQTVLTSLRGSDGFLLDYPTTTATLTSLAVPANTASALAGARHQILARIDPDRDGWSNLEEYQNGIQSPELAPNPKWPDNPGTEERDSDGDGVSNSDEASMGFDPWSNKNTPPSSLLGIRLPRGPLSIGDKDRDMLPDQWEVNHGFNPNSPPEMKETWSDPDEDGLDNETEYTLGTNPKNRDTDLDGMPDGWEVTYDLLPLYSFDAMLDTDFDDLNNRQEYQEGTNPDESDSDGDGTPDKWEIVHHLNPTFAVDAGEDPDADGYSNIEEYQFKTNPRQHNPGRQSQYGDHVLTELPSRSIKRSSSSDPSDNIQPKIYAHTRTRGAFAEGYGWGPMNQEKSRDRRTPIYTTRIWAYRSDFKIIQENKILDIENETSKTSTENSFSNTVTTNKHYTLTKEAVTRFIQETSRYGNPITVYGNDPLSPISPLRHSIHLRENGFHRKKMTSESLVQTRQESSRWGEQPVFRGNVVIRKLPWKENENGESYDESHHEISLNNSNNRKLEEPWITAKPLSGDQKNEINSKQIIKSAFKRTRIGPHPKDNDEDSGDIDSSPEPFSSSEVIEQVIPITLDSPLKENSHKVYSTGKVSTSSFEHGQIIDEIKLSGAYGYDSIVSRMKSALASQPFLDWSAPQLIDGRSIGSATFIDQPGSLRASGTDLSWFLEYPDLQNSEENSLPSVLIALDRTVYDSQGKKVKSNTSILSLQPGETSQIHVTNATSDETLPNGGYITITPSLLPVEVYSDLNNDGQVNSADSGLPGGAYTSGASDDAKDKATEFMFANDSLSNGAWDKEDNDTPGKPGDADDDDAEELHINPGITEGEVWLDHPAIAGLKFYKTRKCTEEIQLSPSSHFTISSSNPFPAKLFVRAESVTFPTTDPQKEGDLKVMIKPTGGAATGIEAAKMKFTIIKDLRAKKYFQGTRDYIFENNTKFFAHDKAYGSSRKFRLCLMREEGSTMYPIDTLHRETPLAGIDAVVGAYPQLSVVVNGNICFFSDPPLIPTAGHMTDKCHGGMVRFGNFDTNVSSHDATKSSLAGPDAKYVAQYDQPKRYEFTKGRVPETPPAGMGAALGGLSTNPNEPDRADREFQMIGYYPSSEQGKGIVFTATQTEGDGGGAQFVDDAKESGVPTNAADGGRPLVFLLDGGTSTAVAHSSPSDQLNVIVKGPKHTWAYKINTYLLFNCVKPRSN